jgi:hypothetical protein
LKRIKFELTGILNIYVWMPRDNRFIVIGTRKLGEHYTGYDLYVKEEFCNADNDKR